MEDGGFQNDVRMTYCASVVMSVIGRYEVELEKAIDFIRRCQVSSSQHTRECSDLRHGKEDILPVRVSLNRKVSSARLSSGKANE